MPKETLLHTKPAALLSMLKDTATTWNLSGAARRAGLSYVHTTKTLRKFEKDGLVSFERKGRAKHVKLTEKGLTITSLLDELMVKLTPPAPAVLAQKEKDMKEVKEKEQKETKEAKEEKK